MHLAEKYLTSSKHKKLFDLMSNIKEGLLNDNPSHTLPHPPQTR